MTAEVAIANTQGVALAADSAVTIGEQKIYNSACKVFSLSKVEPRWYHDLRRCKFDGDSVGNVD